MENCASHLLVALFLFTGLLSGTMLNLNGEKPSSETRMMENSGISLPILLSTRFSVHIHYEKESFRQFSALRNGSRHRVLAVCKQQTGGCPDPMVSEETRPGEMELANIKKQAGERNEKREE